MRTGHGWIDALERPDAPTEPRATHVVLLDYPLLLGAEQNERTTDLLRELALLTASNARHPAEPAALARLEVIAREVTEKYGPQLAEPSPEFRRAFAAHAATTVLRYELSPDSRAQIVDYAHLMEDLDAACRDAALITLAPSEPIHALRRWTVQEFVRQYDGLPPRPWRG